MPRYDSAGAPVGLPYATPPPANAGYSLPAGVAGSGPTPAGFTGAVPLQHVAAPPWPAGLGGDAGPPAALPPGPPTAIPGSRLPMPGGATLAGPIEQVTAPRSAPTWRDLPPDPPFGPVGPYLDPRRSRRSQAPPPVEGEPSRITPWQIAGVVAGVVLLIALGIGAATLLLGDDPEPVDQPAPAESDEEGDPFGQLTPVPNPPAPDEDQPSAPQPSPDPDDELAQGEDGQDGPDAPAPSPGTPEGPLPPTLAPDDPSGELPGTTPDDPSGEAPGSEATPAPGQPQPPGGAQPPGGQAPDQNDPEEGTVQLDRLFELSQLPTRTSEADTTVTQTSESGGDPTIEQVTRLEHPDGDITVEAIRAPDARARYEAQLTDEAREVSVRGQPAFVLEGQRLVWLVEGDSGATADTYLQIDAAEALGTDELLTIANGLELNP